MKLKIFLLVFTISMVSYAQDYNVAMQVSKSDLENNYYEKDSTANALAIYDYGNSFIDKNTFWLRVQIKQKIKILRAEGTERGEYEIRLYKGKSSKEKVLNINGATYNLENGSIKKTELTSSAIFREENEKYTLVKFVLPNVKIGSVITVSYEKQTRFISKFQPWYFQGNDPVLYSEYNTNIPGNYVYHLKLVGSLPLDKHDMTLDQRCIEIGNGASADCSISKYVMKNVPAYKEESFTTQPLNNIARLEFELSAIKHFDGTVEKLTKTWEAVDKELKTDSDFGKQISKKSLAKNVLPNTIVQIDDDLTKAKAIYQFVLDNYKWNKKTERYDVSIKNLVKERVGSVFEINLLLENLLTNEGFEAFPVLMSTRENGFITKIHPVLTEFNYVILKIIIDSKDYFLDATDPYLSFGEIPFRCLNQYGRLIDFENGSYWQDIAIEKRSFRQHRVKFNSFEDDIFSGIIESKFSGYHAHNLKRLFNENPSNYKDRKTDTYPNIDIKELEVIDFDKTNLEFSEKMDISFDPEFIGDKIYLNPFLIKFFEKNPFKLQERTYPIDFGYKDIYYYIMSIDLGENLKVIEIPKPINLALPNKSGRLIFNVTKNNNQLTINFIANFELAIYTPEFYQHLKNFMKKIVETQNNTVIVLEKQ